MKKIFQLLFEEFIKKYGRKPNNLENILLKQKAMQQSIDEKKVIQFPKDRITDWTKPRPTPDKNFIPMRADQYRDVFSKSPDLKKVKKTEAQIKSQIEKQNKKNIKKMKDRKEFSYKENLLKEIDNKIIKEMDMTEKELYAMSDDALDSLRRDADPIRMEEYFSIEPKEPLAGGGIAGMLGEPTYQDDIHRVPYGGGGAGKPPITFTLQGGGGYGKNENIQDMGQTIPGLNQEQYGYGFNLGAEMKLPWNLSLTGDVGISRGSTKTDYKGQPIGAMSGVGETKLGDQWSVGIKGKWPVDFNKLLMRKAEGGRVPLNEGLLVPSEKPSGKEANKILWDKKLNFLKELKGGVGRRDWLNMVSEHLNDGLKQGVISKKQFNRAIMPLFGEAGETQTRALEKDDSLSMNEIMNIYGKDREDYPAYLLAGGGRTGFVKGKLVDAGRRWFLEMMGAGAAGTAAAKSGLFGLLKGGKKEVIKDLTSVPIGNAPGMPPWFKPLVNKVIKEGDDVTKKFATKEREIVHIKKLGDPKDKFADDITVTQDLETGNVRVEYDAADNLGYAPIQLDYKTGHVIEYGPKKGTKSKPEFSAVESEPRVVNWDGDIEFDGENIVSKVDDLLTDTTKLESYATGKNPTIKKLLKSEQKKKHTKNLNEDTMEQLEYIENKQGHMAPEHLMDEPVPDDFASGGRVPLGKGKLAFFKGIGKLMDEFFPGTTKLGKRSKPFPEKVQDKMDLRKALADFQESEKAAKAKSEGPLPGERAGIDVPHMPAGFKLSREKLEQNFPELSLDQIDEIMNLDKEMQGRVITMLKNRRLDPDLYDELLLKHGDTLKFQGEFDKAIRRRKNAQGGIIDRVPYWKGGTWNMIKEAIKHNKIFGLGGPPYKPGATSFDIKQLTKDRFGTELSLQDLKELAGKNKELGRWSKDVLRKEEKFPDFITGFKEYKADVIKQQLLNSKQEAQLRIKVSKDMLKNPPKGVDLAMNKKVSEQMIRDSEKRLKDLDAALKDIDIYKAMKEKTGVASHASGGLAGMLGE